ncbi:hypothetical protein GQ473_02595, partial [archaeon]|nr:hypothetical protein [archaeon]
IIAASTPTGQYHTASELYVDNDIDMNNNKILNSGNITINGSENGIIFDDGTVLTSADNVGGGIPGTAIWIIKTFEWWDSSESVYYLGKITVGSKGGFFGTFEGPGGHHYCHHHIKYSMNGIDMGTIPSTRLNHNLNPSDTVEFWSCPNAACDGSISDGTCLNRIKAWIRIGLWDY